MNGETDIFCERAFCEYLLYLGEEFEDCGPMNGPVTLRTAFRIPTRSCTYCASEHSPRRVQCQPGKCLTETGGSLS